MLTGLWTRKIVTAMDGFYFMARNVSHILIIKTRISLVADLSCRHFHFDSKKQLRSVTRHPIHMDVEVWLSTFLYEYDVLTSSKKHSNFTFK